MPDCFDARLHMSGEQQTTKLKVPAAKRGILIQGGGGAAAASEEASARIHPRHKRASCEKTPAVSRVKCLPETSKKNEHKMWTTARSSQDLRFFTGCCKEGQ